MEDTVSAQVIEATPPGPDAPIHEDRGFMVKWGSVYRDRAGHLWSLAELFDVRIVVDAEGRAVPLITDEMQQVRARLEQEAAALELLAQDTGLPGRSTALLLGARSIRSVLGGVIPGASRASDDQLRRQIEAQALRDAAEDALWCMAAVIDGGRRFTREDLAASLRARAHRIENGLPHPAPTERQRVVGEEDR